MEKIRTILYSEDRKLQPLLSSALGGDFEVFFESDQDGISRVLDSGCCDIIIIDMDSNQGLLSQRLAFARTIAESEVPSIVMADDDLRASAAELVRLGAYSYCRKPPSVRELKDILRRAHESCWLKRKNKAIAPAKAVSSCDRMIGGSPQMLHVYDLVARVANLNASVLVTGESGTGKELIASAIHKLGHRATRPFVAICCGAIPETLIEAELFGHEKGAFTGTVGAREGYLEQAGDGTLFLDEIGELSLSTQVKLLRVLQQREFSRLGSSKLIPLRARIIFATHQNLAEMVAEGKFRQDLYYRINVMRIDAPSLQDRADDIPSIAMHFLRQYAETYGNSITEIDTAAMALLQTYSWPGNVRELENVIQRALIVAHNQTIRAEDLPQDIRGESVVRIDDYHPAGSFERQLRDYKIKLAANAVRDHNGNKTLAARNLHISRAYLHRLIRLAEPDGFGDAPLQEVGTA